jgi:hypothetical protein
MTEKEAKEKWCPYMRAGAVAVQGSGVIGSQTNLMIISNRGQLTSSFNCLGEGCMSWKPYSPPLESFGDAPQEEGFCKLMGM